MLVYKKETKRIIPGVPPRDLTDEEVEQHGGEKSLVGSGLYTQPTRQVVKQVVEKEDKT